MLSNPKTAPDLFSSYSSEILFLDHKTEYKTSIIHVCRETHPELQEQLGELKKHMTESSNDVASLKVWELQGRYTFSVKHAVLDSVRDETLFFLRTSKEICTYSKSVWMINGKVIFLLSLVLQSVPLMCAAC